MRNSGGRVVWIQTSAARALRDWGRFHANMLSLERRNRRLADLDETSAGFALYPTLEPLPDDLRVTKVTYSAFGAASPALDDLLQSYGIDTLLIAGTLTNVCCETTARDGVVLDYNVIMVSDANATLADTQHAAALNTFMMFFGDVMMADEVERCIEGADSLPLLISDHACP